MYLEISLLIILLIIFITYTSYTKSSFMPVYKLDCSSRTKNKESQEINNYVASDYQRYEVPIIVRPDTFTTRLRDEMGSESPEVASSKCSINPVSGIGKSAMFRALMDKYLSTQCMQTYPMPCMYSVDNVYDGRKGTEPCGRRDQFGNPICNQAEHITDGCW